MLVSSYNTALVVCSIVVAILASFTALTMAARVSATGGRARAWWLAGGASAMGLGVWSMHFIGMLAFSVPIPLGYDVPLTLASLLIAIVASAFALWLICSRELPWIRVALGAVPLGLGIAAMHYTGMLAMRMEPGIRYDPVLFLASIVIAVAASGVALALAFHLRANSPRNSRFRVVAAVILGFGIAGMHYTGMAAAEFPVGSICGASADGADPHWLAVLVIVFTLAVLAIAAIVAVLDTRLEQRTAELTASLAEANRELTALALHDSLTTLPNRVLLEDRMTQALEKARRDTSRFAVIFMDLDGFKNINDAYGHHAGDELLVSVADRIRATMRGRDTLARLGGDEFVALLNIDTPEDAATVAQKIVTTVDQVAQVSGRDVRVTISAGIAVYPGDGDTLDDLLKNADAAMYHAKEIGRNGYCFFESSMNADAHELLQVMADLRSAIERDEFVLHYQPKYDVRSGAIVGTEALVRWQHPVRGLVPPDAFIPLAEKTGLISALGEWVVNEACRQMRLWRDAGRSGWTIAVNISALQFNPGLVEMLAATLARHELDPRCLVVEITESTAMRDPDASLFILAQLAAMGIGISIDDFGTGYSSLMHLKRLPASELKIDRGFIRDLAHGSEDVAIVNSIIALGQTLNLLVVAEGVETQAQHDVLTRLGCDSFQGFLFARPMPASDVEKLAGP